MELKITHKTEIPVFFSTDDNYVPFLDVAIRSLKQNASKDYSYKIIVLNTGLKEESILKVKLLEDENIFLKDKLTDCGMLIYDRKTQDVHCGGSGCGCIASVLSAYFLKQIEEQKVKNILFSCMVWTAL